MDPDKRYYTMGVFVHDFMPKRVDMSIEDADIVRSAALEIAKNKDVEVRFQSASENGPRAGQAALKLPKWVWANAFELLFKS